MSFPPEDLERIEASRLVRIETQRPHGPVHLTTIWVVVDGEQVFVRSWHGVAARWYREALANPAVAIHVGKHRIPATAVHATDPDSVERASAGLLRKYAGDPATASMVRDEILGTTLRLEPV